MKTIKHIMYALEETVNEDIVTENNNIDIIQSNGSDLKEIEKIDNFINNASDDFNVIEDIKDIAIKSNIENNGLSSIAAEMASISLEKIIKRLDIDIKNRLPALESFDNIATRNKATNIALETLEEIMDNIWKGILRALYELWRLIQKYFLMLFGAAEQMKLKATNMKEIIKRLGHRKKIGSLDSKKARYFFSDLSGIMDNNNIVKIISNIIDSLKRITKVKDAIDYKLDSMMDKIKEFKPEGKTLIDFTALIDSFTFRESLDGLILDEKKNFYKKYIAYRNNLTVYELSHPLSRQKILAMYFETEHDSINSTIFTEVKKHKLKLDFFTSKFKVSELPSVIDDPLEKSEMTLICSLVIDLANSLISNRYTIKKVIGYQVKIDKIFNELILQVNKITKGGIPRPLDDIPTKAKIIITKIGDIFKATPPNTAINAKEAHKLINVYKSKIISIKDIIVKYFVAMPDEGLSTGIAALEYVSECMAQY